MGGKIICWVCLAPADSVSDGVISCDDEVRDLCYDCAKDLLDRVDERAKYPALPHENQRAHR